MKTKKTNRIWGRRETQVKRLQTPYLLKLCCQVNEYPWMARVDIESHRIKAGGALIASQWVVTTAEAILEVYKASDLSSIKVILGEHDISTQKESKIPRKEIKVEKIIRHNTFTDG